MIAPLAVAIATQDKHFLDVVRCLAIKKTSQGNDFYRLS